MAHYIATIQACATKHCGRTALGLLHNNTQIRVFAGIVRANYHQFTVVVDTNRTSKTGAILDCINFVRGKRVERQLHTMLSARHSSITIAEITKAIEIAIVEKAEAVANHKFDEWYAISLHSDNIKDYE